VIGTIIEYCPNGYCSIHKDHPMPKAQHAASPEPRTGHHAGHDAAGATDDVPGQPAGLPG